jgi:hypothetical protein
MNIRIGDKVKILDEKMGKYYMKNGIVVDANRSMRYRKKWLWKPKFNNWFYEEEYNILDEEIIAFEVKVKGLPIASFGEENLVAYK